MSGSSLSSSSPTGMGDPLELFDFHEYDANQYQSASTLTSPGATKAQFTINSATVTTPSTLPTTQTLSGPSHQYDQYKQQTPFVPGALSSTIAINNSSQLSGYAIDYMPSEISSHEDTFDFNTVPSRNMSTTDMDLDFEPQADASFFFSDTTIDPNAIGGESQAMMSPTVPSQTSNVGRMYPGMHQQAALAKAQAQQRQQQHLIQQRQNQQVKHHRPKPPLPKTPMPSDPIVEQKITQLLNSMRSKAGASPGDSSDNSTLSPIAEAQKRRR
ncbi:putative bZIP transcription factor [Daldinia childiae]|uniref:putative bZIP transcription factor n=1 Tax=Daldinia childiae TaxID=326645 RepID=UPI001447C352|nr:putative bZIP transcription factor [Daldinia childiae]KAF3071226.1 putative bZIP transcription factor [Daldinia childiae]